MSHSVVLAENDACVHSARMPWYGEDARMSPMKITIFIGSIVQLERSLAA